MIIGLDPKNDYAFKRVFGMERNEPILRHLADAVLMPPPGHHLMSLELLNPFTEKEDLTDKLAVLDIKARDQSGRLFNIEMQMSAYGPFRPRALYYWAKLHQGQLQEGDDYRVLRPTVSICFVNTLLFPEVPDCHLLFELRTRQHQVVFTDQMALHILELPKFTKSPEELTTLLDVWLYFLRHGEHLDTDALPAALAIPEVRRALEELQMLSQNELERERYEARRKGQRDLFTAVAEARDEGLQRGIDEGLQRGIAGHIRALERLLQRVPTPEPELLTRSTDELGRIAQQLEDELARVVARTN